MGESNSSPSVISFSFPWLIIFILIKVKGTAFAAWSWWWVLLPVVPDLVVFLRKLGLL